MNSFEQQVFANMFGSRKEKFESFIKKLRNFIWPALLRFGAEGIPRNRFFVSYYVAMRYLDDIADRDIKPPKLTTPQDYLREKIDFVRHSTASRDIVDQMLLWCFYLGNEFGCDFRAETADILESLLFDAERYGKNIVFDKATLEKHFHTLDIRGVVKATLKVYGEDPEKYTLLTPLAEATRMYYDLRDYDEDIAKGFINIPLEDIAELGFDLRLDDKAHVKPWFLLKAHQGLELLADHKKVEKEFGWLARSTFPLVYAKPAERFFRNVLRNF